MSDKGWFSTKLRFAVMVEPEGASRFNDSIFLLKASDFPAAFERAIAIGEVSQQEYRNTHGQRVHWKFMEVVSIDVIQSEDLDGREVFSEPVHLDEEETIPFETEFNPMASKPFQTI